MSNFAESRFAVNPTRLDISRSKFYRNSSYKTTFNVGDIIPFYVDEVLPGDTFKIKTSKLIRLQSLITPVMDNLYVDFEYYFVPNRLVDDHWKEVMGENNDSAWIPQNQYTVPQITSPASTGWTKGTIADYMGIPTGVAGLSVNALPIRAYALICDQWWRDENLSDPLVIPKTDATVAGSNGSTDITDVAKGGMPYKASKYHDYFTSALPTAQKGPAVTIGVLNSVPVYAGVPFSSDVTANWPKNSSGEHYPLKFRLSDNSTLENSGNTTAAPNLYASGANGNGFTYSASSSTLTTGKAGGVFPVNLYADLASQTMTTINQLRLAFQIQKLYERDARGGTRYIEMIKSHFGVTSPDSRLQRSEFLGGNRVPIKVSQVVQTSETSTTPQGNVAGYSVTGDSHHDFVRSFTEHGFVIGVMVARYDHSYQQGLERFWSRKSRLDYYFPVLANIGEQAILNKEIYADGSSTDDEVFGYQEAWADYRYKPSRVTGEMRSNYATSLDVWHYADDYAALPTLSDGWIKEDKSNVDRTLAVQSAVSDQLLADIYIENESTRAMPMYSIPGLIDHH